MELLLVLVILAEGIPVDGIIGFQLQTLLSLDRSDYAACMSFDDEVNRTWSITSCHRPKMILTPGRLSQPSLSMWA
jgi:hypothetical protein